MATSNPSGGNIQEMPVRLGQRIRKLREEAGYSARELAEMVETSPPYLSRIEHGGSIPKLPLMQLLADALGTELEDLLSAAGYKIRPRNDDDIHPRLRIEARKKPMEVQRAIAEMLAQL